ncbi:ATP-binding protein [Spirochaeta cellobiosiphila]|uniref:ATP-binding protein n=1 Tax=Spirochaeta cellobiosiphila TaxID=504483 RepID=UPI00069E110F|nr:ATP-binding protein [Spirochaeta cellobiosiphila]
MKIGKNQKSINLRSFTSLIVLYFILISLIILFSSQTLNNITLGREANFPIILNFALILPAGILIAIVIYALSVYRELRKDGPGVKLKIKLILSFSLLSLISAIPQTILSVNFVTTALTEWYNPQLEKAINGSLTITLDYYQEKLDNLGKFARSPSLLSVLQGIDINPDLSWKKLSDYNPAVDSLEVFREDGTILVFLGDPKANRPFSQIQRQNEGPLPRRTEQGQTFLSYLKLIESGSFKYYVVLSDLLSPDFQTNTNYLTNAVSSINQIKEYRNQFWLLLPLLYMFFAVPLFLISILISFLLSEDLIRPLANLEEATKRVIDGDFSFRILSRGKDDFGMLAQSFNKMILELENSRKQILQTEKITAWQEIAQRLAHEIRNPLTPIKLSAQRLLKRYETKPETIGELLRPAVTAIVTEVDGLDNLIKEFRDFARLPSSHKQKINLNDIVLESIKVYKTSNPNIQFDTEGVPQDFPMKADPNQLKQIFTNLIKNAIDAMKGSGQITFRADEVKKGTFTYCRIQIQDAGEGIKEDIIDKVFHPYYTTKHGGSGLGLSIVERIVHDHGGQIWFESQENVGTTFFIDIRLEVENEYDINRR